jgi:preprotein translocase subunit SecD
VAFGSHHVRRLLAPALASIVLASAAGCTSPSKQASTTSEEPFVVLQARTQGGTRPRTEDLDDAVSILRQRAKALGIEVIVESDGSDRITVRFPGRPVPAKELPSLTASGALEFYDLETSLSGPSISPDGAPVEHASLYRLLAPVQSQVRAGTSDAYYVFSRTGHLVGGPFGTKNEAANEVRAKDGRQLFAVPHGMVVVTCDVEDAVLCPGADGVGINPRRTYYYLFKYDPPNVPQITGQDLKLGGTRAEFDPQFGRPIVRMAFTTSGARTFREITRDEWIRGRLRNTSQHFGVVLDRELKTFPQIDYTDASISSGIGGGLAEIEGLDSSDEAKSIAATLQTGAVPLRLTIVESHL